MATNAKPSYWASPNLSPKRNYKWYLSFGNLALPTWIVKSVTKPSFSIGEAQHTYINHTFYYPGKISWNTVDVTVVDPGEPNDASKKLVDAIRASGYAYPNQPGLGQTIARNAGVTFSKAAATNQVGTVILRQLGAQGFDNVVDRWTLYNAWIKDVQFGQLSYDNEDLTDVTLTLRYDWAVHNTKDDSAIPGLIQK